jgi:hypothetical protein
VGAHSQGRIDGVDVVGKIFVDMRHRTCLRAECPTCYEKWAGKGAHKIEYRLSQWRGSGRVIHLMISVPSRLYHLSMVELRILAYRVAREIGFFGGSCIVHPFRQRCKICGSPKDTMTDRCLNCGCGEFLWVFSPHFHLLGYGWILGEKVKELYESEGWISKNLGIRDSVGATALYQLSHAGIHKNHHTITWFGALAYNKLKVAPEIVESKVCPLCGGDLIRLLWVGDGECPVPGEEGEYFVEPEGWVPGYSWPGIG